MVCNGTVRQKTPQRNRLGKARSEAISAAVTDWFGAHKRPLKFRETRDPYAIMVSEFMLQQTTVAAVQSYYERFLTRFPTVRVLAEANEEEVLAHWAGLGYYRRARNLHAAAQMVVEQWDGVFPTTVAELQTLPGVGRYTAGAIASSAFDVAAPVLEANTVRVYARLAGEVGVVGDSAFTGTLWQIGEELVQSATSPREFNMGAMELGALVCKPRPDCDRCPVTDHCAAFRSGTQELTPVPRPKPVKVDVQCGCVVLEDAGRYLVRRIPTGQWHEGMWEFPVRRKIDGQVEPDSLFADLLKQCGLKAETIQELTILRYTITHHRVTCHVYYGKINRALNAIELDDGNPVFMTLEQLADYAMSSAQRKLLRMLQDRESEEGGDRC